MKLTDAILNRGPFAVAIQCGCQPIAFRERLRHWFNDEIVFPMIMYAERPGNLRWRFGWWLNETFCMGPTQPKGEK